MTNNVFLDGLIIFLIAYAIISIFHDIADCILNRFSKCTPKNCVVLKVSHGSESLENELRTALRHSGSIKCKLLVVCDNLDECEEKIIKYITCGAEGVEITTPDELPRKIKEKL
ncbi:MAG: hypothetical protein IKU87_00600 [Clostridia bacterium]|nr:hypothetical protein [Clostridia bacterium]